MIQGFAAAALSVFCIAILNRFTAGTTGIGLVLLTMFFVAGIAMLVPAIIALISRNEAVYRGIAVSLYTFILFVGASIGALLPTWLINMEISSFYGLAGCFLMLGAIINAPVLNGVINRAGRHNNEENA